MRFCAGVFGVVAADAAPDGEDVGSEAVATEDVDDEDVGDAGIDSVDFDAGIVSTDVGAGIDSTDVGAGIDSDDFGVGIDSDGFDDGPIVRPLTGGIVNDECIVITSPRCRPEWRRPP